ncbi:hypothetical protein D6D25_09779 [Aureobasidium pullulans]|nr:hypothetical protein D6D25_09779 [Aureobasidium pullulans]
MLCSSSRTRPKRPPSKRNHRHGSFHLEPHLHHQHPRNLSHHEILAPRSPRPYFLFLLFFCKHRDQKSRIDHHRLRSRSFRSRDTSRVLCVQIRCSIWFAIILAC